MGQKKEKKRFRQDISDMTFVVVVLLLLGIGVVMMFSASYAIAINEGNEGYFYVKRQGIFGGIGLVAMYIMSKIDYHIFQNPLIALGSYVTSVILLILVLLIGTDLGTGCQRWLQFPGFSFQPSEIAKFAVIILFSYTIDKNYDKMQKFSFSVLPYGIMLGILVILLVKEPHVSCIILICAISLILIFVGGISKKNLFILIVVGSIAVAALVMIQVYREGATYITTRLETWLHPFDSPDEEHTWQARQSLIAIGSGGWFGLGLGESRQKYLYLPESENDYVFSIVCEELGLIGAITVLLLFVTLVMEGFHIASRSQDRFGSLLAIGFTSQIGLQAFINMAVVTGVFPTTGISLPFFSYGGTALAMQLMQMGIVLNVSRKRIPILSRRQTPENDTPFEVIQLNGQPNQQ